MVGKTLAHYEVTEKIGVGGMGEVYRAKDTKLGRDVALKVLPPLLANDSERLLRFQREAKLLASLNHPNIATLHGLEEADGIHFLIMKLPAWSPDGRWVAYDSNESGRVDSTVASCRRTSNCGQNALRWVRFERYFR